MKYFLTSDLHSFYKPLKKALDEAGFDINNNEHVLVVLGDIFDRGTETKKVFDFLMSIPSERLVLIRGNHEDLFVELTRKFMPDNYDFSNGTVRTFCDIAHFPYQSYFEIYNNWDIIVQKVLESEESKLIFNSKMWKNYYIIDDKYVCVHSSTPLIKEWEKEENAQMWKEARWRCPYSFHEGYWGKIGKGKTLVCGHWHASDFHKRYENVDEDYSVYRGETLIALDACTAYTGKTNILVLDTDEK